MSLRLLTATSAMLGLLALCSSLPAAQSPAYLNVKDFGAVGDGKADDTQPFVKAIEAGAKQNLPVCVPRGHYKVTKPLKIDQQSIVGSEPGGWPSDYGPMPAILVEHDAGPALTMGEGASVHGLMFLYDEKAGKRPPTILLGGGGICISNVRIQYCTDGIMWDGKTNIGRLNIENVFIVSPSGVGVHVACTYDLPTLRNIEVWNNLNRPNVTAFRFGRNDGLRGSHLVAFQTAVGFELADDPNGGCWGVFVDCGTDACTFGWKVEGKTGHTVAITGGYFWDHYQTLLLKNPNLSMRVANAEIQSNGGPVVDAQACYNLLLTGCRIGRAIVNTQDPYINLQAVNCFTMGSCVVTPMGPVLGLGQGLKQAAITGNVFDNSPYARILRDDRSKDADIVIANNSGMTPTPTQKTEQPK